MGRYTKVTGFYFPQYFYEVRHHLTCFASSDNVRMKEGEFSAKTTLPTITESFKNYIERLKVAGCFGIRIVEDS